MAHMHVLMQRLGKLADQAPVLLVTVDRARDTPKVLHADVNAFNSHAAGLTGSASHIKAMVKRYRVSFTREPSSQDGALRSQSQLGHLRV